MLDRCYLAQGMPTLLLWGSRDSIVPVRHAHGAHAAMPGSRLEIFEGAGHFPFHSDPARFLALVEDFIRTTAPADWSQEHWRELLRAYRPGSGDGAPGPASGPAIAPAADRGLRGRANAAPHEAVAGARRDGPAGPVGGRGPSGLAGDAAPHGQGVVRDVRGCGPPACQGDHARFQDLQAPEEAFHVLMAARGGRGVAGGALVVDPHGLGDLGGRDIGGGVREDEVTARGETVQQPHG